MYHQTGMKWVVFASVVIPFAFAEIVVKPDGMFAVRMDPDSCSLPKHLDMSGQDHDDGNGTLSRVQLDSDSCGRYNEGIEGPAIRISGGDVYPPNEYPFISALVKCYDDCKCLPFCGASIISRSHVLTAAHCIADLGSSKLYVLVGAYEIFSNESCPYSIQVRSIAKHPAYDGSSLVNDIAVLTLKTPIKFGTDIGPVCLPGVGTDPDDGDEVKILGWGADRYHGSMSPKPKEMITKVTPIASCAKQWPCVRPTKPSQICTWSQDAAPCQGDSGGPVVWLDPQSDRYYLVGIVSFGPQCDESKPSVQTRVSAYLNWIRQQLQ